MFSLTFPSEQVSASNSRDVPWVLRETFAVIASGCKIHRGCSASTSVTQRVPGRAEAPGEHPALLQEPLTHRAGCRLLPDCCVSCSGFLSNIYMTGGDRQTDPPRPELWIITHCRQRIHSARILKGTLGRIYVLLLYSPNGKPGLLVITHHLRLAHKVPHKRSWHTVI